MKKISKMMALSLLLALSVVFVKNPVYADSEHKYEVRMVNIMSGDCDFRIDDSGELTLSAIADARHGKTIYGKITIQRKTSSSWKNIKTYRETGRDGELYMDESYKLNTKGSYRLKFTISCDGESYSYYSKTRKYN